MRTEVLQLATAALLVAAVSMMVVFGATQIGGVDRCLGLAEMAVEARQETQGEFDTCETARTGLLDFAKKCDGELKASRTELQSALAKLDPGKYGTTEAPKED